MVYGKKTTLKSILGFTVFALLILSFALPVDSTGDDLSQSLDVEYHFISIEPREKLEIDEVILFNYSVFFLLHFFC